MYFWKPPCTNSEPTILYSAKKRNITPTATRTRASTRRAFASLMRIEATARQGYGKSDKRSSGLSTADLLNNYNTCERKISSSQQRPLQRVARNTQAMDTPTVTAVPACEMLASRLVIQVSGDGIGGIMTILFFLEAGVTQKAGPKKYIESLVQVVELSALT